VRIAHDSSGSGVRRDVYPTGTPSRLTLGEPLFRGLPTRDDRSGRLSRSAGYERASGL
jgi:hypothetical protein